MTAPAFARRVHHMRCGIASGDFWPTDGSVSAVKGGRGAAASAELPAMQLPRRTIVAAWRPSRIVGVFPALAVCA